MNGAEQIFVDKKSKVGVLLLHGFSSTPGELKELGDFLARKGFNVLAPLIAGHGTNVEDFTKTSPKDWTNSALMAYLKLKSISEKVFIIGNSFGSNLGLWLAKELGNEPAGIVALGVPIFLRFHNFIKLRLFLYGRLRKYYKKPSRFYKGYDIAEAREIAYSILSDKNIKDFVGFLEKETRPNLKKIKIPILIASSNADPIIHPKSVEYVFKNIGSEQKEIFWFKSTHHDIVGKGCEDLFLKIYEFIKENV